MPAIRFERLREDLILLAHRGHDVSAFSQAAARVLRRAVPFDGFCMLTLDPATLLPTGEVVENGLPPDTRPRMAEIEIAGNDFNKFPALALSDAARRDSQPGHGRQARSQPPPSRPAGSKRLW